MQVGDFVLLTVEGMTRMQIIALDGAGNATCAWHDEKQANKISRADYPLIMLSPWPAEDLEEEPIGFFRG